MAAIIIHSAGLLTTVQDLGRVGYQRFGMSVAGAMDTFSLRLANLLVGNEANAACLETTIFGPEIIFAATGSIAICGADMRPCKNGKSIPNNKTIKVRMGDRLSFEGLLSGCRSYIAFAGGIDVPVIMGSRSTYLRAKIGGFEGRSLKAGDKLHLGKAINKIQRRKIPSNEFHHLQPGQAIRVISGPEAERFGPEGFRHLLTSEYSVSAQSDRMGYRLSGPAMNTQAASADIISAGMSFGTIQMPGNGQPIILMADRPTTGGYARIANVAGVDLTLLAQLKPGDYIRFSEISLAEAQGLYVNRQKLIERFADDLA
ncbi:MAG: biotin-dependent carboxyltransferase family protein [Bacteroidales bacterium]|nr:biotin-dependent carboxyltransferase family protein [Bacteroidales bacterium]MDZ4204390.1 biotin-dependent carboxyltransferase family protein [Bacteroidales bacterium]